MALSANNSVLWSLRAVVGRAVEMVRQRVALVSGITAAPEAGGGRDQGRQVAPLARRTFPTATSSHERANAGTAAPAPQEPAQALAPPTVLPSGQLPAMVSVQPVDGAKQLAIKKWLLYVREIHCRAFSPKNMGNIPKLS